MTKPTRQGKAKTLISVTDYGVYPDTGQDAVPGVRQALAAASAMEGPVIVDFPIGRYDFYPDQADRVLYYISNTTTEDENLEPIKTIAIKLQGLNDVSLEGNSSLWLFHGKMTLLAIMDSSAIEICNVNTDYVNPTMAEMTVERVGDRTMDVIVHPDSRYELQNGRLHWVGPGWRFADGPAQQYDPVSNRTWRVPNPVQFAELVEELEPARLRFHYAVEIHVEVGHTFQMRDGIRDQVGVWINRSASVTFRQMGLHYMHGLGIVGQYSEDLVFERLTLAPRSTTGRTAAAFADFLHLSGCCGKITVTDSVFEGAHDDPINVHGTHLRIVGRPKPTQVIVRFMHGQSYGFEAFSPGDEIEFVSSRSLQPYAWGKVVEARLLSPREILVTLEGPAPELMAHDDVVENITWTPEVEIRGNRFARVPTRGILLNTRRKAIIADNVFERMGMSGILIANDARSWFESGPVHDVTITGNTFVECGGETNPVIWIHPENTEVLYHTPVHRNITIANNKFVTGGHCLMDAKSTQNLRFVGNAIQLKRIQEGEQKLELEAKPMPVQPLLRVQACSKVVVEGNVFTGTQRVGIQSAELIGMPLEEVTVGGDQGIVLESK